MKISFDCVAEYDNWSAYIEPFNHWGQFNIANQSDLLDDLKVYIGSRNWSCIVWMYWTRMSVDFSIGGRTKTFCCTSTIQPWLASSILFLKSTLFYFSTMVNKQFFSSDMQQNFLLKKRGLIGGLTLSFLKHCLLNPQLETTTTLQKFEDSVRRQVL